jgi:hypothetical protein
MIRCWTCDTTIVTVHLPMPAGIIRAGEPRQEPPASTTREYICLRCGTRYRVTVERLER